MTQTNRVAIVTGASRGLGEVIARVLAERGHDLVIGARDSAALTRVRDQLSRGNRRVVALGGDVTDAAAVADELYLSIYSQRPSAEEAAAVAAFLAPREADRPAALQELAWAMIAAAEDGTTGATATASLRIARTSVPSTSAIRSGSFFRSAQGAISST